MQKKGMKYTVEVKPPHKDWGMVRNPTNRTPRDGESYVKIPSKFAKNLISYVIKNM